MGEYEPDDSRDITRKSSDLPIEPERTGPREGETRKPANQTDPAKGSVSQRSGHRPKGKDLPRGSEPETRASSINRA